MKEEKPEVKKVVLTGKMRSTPKDDKESGVKVKTGLRAGAWEATRPTVWTG